MLFILIILVFFFIALVSFYGNLGERELNKDKKDWERIMGKKYYG